jgi:hypothetical protein
MKKSIYSAPTVTVRGDVMTDTLGFKKVGCDEAHGRWSPDCPPPFAGASYGL